MDGDDCTGVIRVTTPSLTVEEMGYTGTGFEAVEPASRDWVVNFGTETEKCGRISSNKCLRNGSIISMFVTACTKLMS